MARPFLLDEEKQMHYFIASQENPTHSTIEIAQMQRVHLFEAIGQGAKIIEVEYNLWHDDAQASLHSAGSVINLFHYYQKLDLQTERDNDDELIEQILHSSDYDVQEASTNCAARESLVFG